MRRSQGKHGELEAAKPHGGEDLPRRRRVVGRRWKKNIKRG